MHYVYYIWNLDEDLLLYIGRSINPEDRLRDFIRREGISAVLGQTHGFTNMEDACRAELQAIATHWPPYNRSLVSSRGGWGISKPMDPSVAEKIRAAHLGRPNSDIHNERIARARKGMKFTQEHCFNMSLSRKGKKPTAETRAKLSASRLGKKRGPYKKRPKG